MEYKNNEHLLATNSSRINLAMDSANMAWWELSLPSGEINFDKRKSDMLGYEFEDFKHFQDFMKYVHPEDVEKSMNAMQVHIYGEAEKYEVEYRILAKKGEYHCFYDVGSVVKRHKNGAPAFVMGIVIDITERKRLEKELKEAQENIHRTQLAQDRIYHSLLLDNSESKILAVKKKLLAFQGNFKNKAIENDFMTVLSELDKLKINPLQEFEMIFKELHPDFYQKLYTINSSLSTREVQICALLKFQLNSKQIAQIVSLEPASIDTFRTRIRSKLRLGAKDSLSNFLVEM